MPREFTQKYQNKKRRKKELMKKELKEARKNRRLGLDHNGYL